MQYVILTFNMNKLNKKSLRLYCFSPPVMLATFCIEIAFAIYIIWRYKFTPISRLIVAILICLAVFQGAEFLLCGMQGFEGGFWSRVAYLAITLLPPLGIHLTLTIANKKNQMLISAAYLSAVAFITFFLFYSPAISGHTCYANYAVLRGNAGFAPVALYAVYYYGWLVAGTYLCWKYSRELNKKSQKHMRNALYALAVGYIMLLLPTTAVNIVDPSTVAGIPSVMCGFAVILAFILVSKVAPEAEKKKPRN